MPTYDYICEYCGAQRRAWRENRPPHFCDKLCEKKAGYPYSKGTRSKWNITPEMHEAIKKVYQTYTGNGEVKARI